MSRRKHCEIVKDFLCQRSVGLSALAWIFVCITNEVSGFVRPAASTKARSCFSSTYFLKSNGVLDLSEKLPGGTESPSKVPLFDPSLSENQPEPAMSDNKCLDVQTLLMSIALGIVLVFSATVSHANAGFGPSSRAVTSPPPGLFAPNIQDGDVVSRAKKLKQLIGSALDQNRLQEFGIQLDELAKTLVNGEEEGQAELEKARIFQQQIVNREKALDKLDQQPDWFNYLAAFIGSVASTLVMHPLDTIKTRLQAKVLNDDEDDGSKDIAGLFEGLAGNILKEGPPSALYLGVYESAKHSLVPRFGPEYVLIVYLISGAAGEMVGSVVRAPAEAIKSTVQLGIEDNALDAAVRLLGSAKTRTNIVRAWSASVWRDVPFGAIQLAIFELTKSYILNNPNIDFDSSTLLSEALIGAFAGGCGALVTNPFDVITTRIISQDVDGNSQPLGVLEMGIKLYEEGGLAAFLVGWQARVLYWSPAISIFLSCYCSVRKAGVGYSWFTS